MFLRKLRDSGSYEMSIPALTAEGLLPEGIHDCTLDELRERFGQFQRTDKRPRLFKRLEALVQQAERTGFVVAIIIGGSFVTDVDVPNDVDIILVLRADHDSYADLPPFAYNVVSKRQVRRMHGIDMLVGRERDDELNNHVLLFSSIRDVDDSRKGVLRVRL